MIKFALIKELKSPPDKRAVFSPSKLKELVKKYPEAHFKVQSSPIRIFKDQEYRDAGFEVANEVSDCDVFLGVKEVPVDALINDKKYFFFSHTIKKQPYNQNLLQSILEKNIQLFDHEVIVNEKGHRLIGFGYYAGIVGAYNCIRGLGIKEQLFDLPKAENLENLDALKMQLDKITIPNKKIILTGSGKVANGAKYILDHLKIKKVEVEEYLKKTFNEPVYCIIDVLDYNKPKANIKASIQDFFDHPENYESNFMRFAKVSDIFIAGHFYGQGAPVFFTAEDAKSPDFKIELVADISCDVNGPIASTIRSSTIASPFYGYHKITGIECDYREKDAIMVMAVDNLPCELPRDATEGFGDMFMEHVISAFFNNDKDGILERALMTKNGKLTSKFSYLQDFVDNNL